MLYDFVLDEQKLKEQAEERGFISGYKPHTYEGKEYQILHTTVNPDHPFIKEHNINLDFDLSHTLRYSTGLYYANDMEHVLDEMSTTPCIDPYLTFNLGTGEYMTRDEMQRQFNLGWEKLDEEVPDEQQWHHFQTGAYGIADSIEQIVGYYHAVIGNPKNKVVIALRELNREKQDSSGGFRWHKNGKYIGTKNPQHEYFYDDKHIDKIVTFHVYCVQ